MTVLSDSHFGIEQRVQVNVPFQTAKIKQSPADFQVNEIDCSGKVLYHSNEFFFDPSFQPPPILLKNEKAAVVTSVDDLILKLNITQELAQSILNLYSEPNNWTQIIIPDVDDKSSRKNIHEYFKAHFGGKLVTDCPSGTHNIRISRRGKQAIIEQSGDGDDQYNRKRPRYDVRNDKQLDTFAYVEFVVQKENLDTMDVVQYLSKALHISPKDITFAGTKDRLAITTQRMVIRNIALSKLVGIRDKHSRIKLSHVRPTTQQVNLGALQGNRFTLTLRDVCPLPSSVENVNEHFKYFINYYGRQRFGTQGISTHDIGIALLQLDFQKASDLLFQVKEEDPQPLINAKRAYLETHTSDAAHELLSLLPRQQHVESSLLNVLQMSPNDYQNAWLAVKRESRLLYVHAVQSFVWNKLASFRICQLGLQVFPGDLVAYTNGNGDEDVKIVTEIDRNSFSIEQVVLPLMGEEISLPEQNDMKSYLNQLLTDLGLEESFFQRPTNKSLWDLRGDYRRLVIQPKNITSSIANDCVLQLSFDLPKSAYATMALRELFKDLQ